MTAMTTVSATKLCDSSGNPIVNATISFQPVLVPATGAPFPCSYVIGGGTLAADTPVSATVAGGVFSLPLADTKQTNPADIAFAVTCVDNLTQKDLLGPGWGTFQPTGSAVAFDTVPPNLAPSVTVQQGPPGPAGSITFPVTTAATFQAPASFTELTVNGAKRVSIPTVQGWAYALVDQTTGRCLYGIKQDGTAVGLKVPTTGGGGGGASSQLASGVTTDGTNQNFPGNLTIAGDVTTATRRPLYPNVQGAVAGFLDASGKRFIIAWDATGKQIVRADQVPVTTVAAAAPTTRYPYDAAAFTAALNHYIGYGESLYVAPDSSPALSTTASTTAKMFSTGPNATTNGTTNTLTALVESGVETQSSGFAGMLAARLAPKGLSHPLLVSGAAHSGYTYAQLAGPTTAGGTGTAQFQELMAQITAGKALAPSTYTFRGIFLDLGINDNNAGTSQATFQSDLVTLQSDIQAGAAAILGNIPPIKIWFEECQYSLGLAQAQLCALYPDLFGMYVVGSQIEHHPASEIASIPSIGVHESNYGQRNKGEYAALTIEREVLQASRWVVPHPRSFTVVGNTAQVNYFTDSQIALDTSWMGVRPNSGFAFSDNYGTTITGVAVTGVDQITVTFSRTPSPTGRTLSYGMIDETGAYADGQGPSGQQGPLYGRGGNVRNTSSVLSTYTQRGGAHTSMHLYGSKFSYSI